MLACVVEVDGVHADDGETHDELEEAKDEAQDRGWGKGAAQGGSKGGFFAPESAIRKEFEGHFFNIVRLGGTC